MDAANRLLGACRQGQSKSENSSAGQKCNARGPWEEGNSNARSEGGTELQFVRAPENERRRCPGCLELPMATRHVHEPPRNPGYQAEVLIRAPARLRNRSAACARSGWLLRELRRNGWILQIYCGRASCMSARRRGGPSRASRAGWNR